MVANYIASLYKRPVQEDEKPKQPSSLSIDESISQPEQSAFMASYAETPPIPIHPETPPLTPEGNQEALAAVHRMAGMFDIRDPEIGRWLAESPDLSFYTEHSGLATESNFISLCTNKKTL